MIELNKKYYNSPYYFYLKDNGNSITVHYKVTSNLNESKKEEKKVEVPKTKEKEIKSIVTQILKNPEKTSAEKLFPKISKTRKETKKGSAESYLVAKILSTALNNYVLDGDFKLAKKDLDFIKSLPRDAVRAIPAVLSSFFTDERLIDEFISKLQKKTSLHFTTNTKETQSGEIDEFVDEDGTFSSSAIPILDRSQHTQWTQDMRASLTRMASGGFPFKARIYYGESIDGESTIDEENFLHAFGKEEMDNENVKTFKECLKVFKDLEVKDPFERYERCMSFGFDPELDDEGKQRIVELRKEKMRQMIDELLLDKKTKEEEIYEKEKQSQSPVEKIIIRNLEAIKKIADKHGLELRHLLKKVK
jgi:hypothetical protein